MNITESEVLEAIRVAMPTERGVEDAFSSEDLREQMGWGILKARRVLRLLVRSGKVEAVPMVRPTMAGYARQTVGYRFTKAAP